MKLLNYPYLIALILCASCNNNALLNKNLESVRKSIKADYAPDKRVAVFDIQFNFSDNKMIASGMTDSKEAYLQLLE